LTRAAVYFALWEFLALLMNRWAAAHDREPNPALSKRMRDFGGPGLILLGLGITFASIDWTMSLDPSWYSSIFPTIVAVGQMVPALAFSIAAAVWWSSHQSEEERVDVAVWVDLGSLMLAFVMLWAYVSFSQLLLIWSGNLPEEISWYIARSRGGWEFIAIMLAVFYFVVPFLVLLSRTNKWRINRLQLVVLFIVAMSALNQFWLVVPAYRQQSHEEPLLSIHWLDVTALVGLGGVWLATFLWQLQARPLWPPQPLREPEMSRHV
jgi:hypothetical protein